MFRLLLQNMCAIFISIMDNVKWEWRKDKTRVRIHEFWGPVLKPRSLLSSYQLMRHQKWNWTPKNPNYWKWKETISLKVQGHCGIGLWCWKIRTTIQTPWLKNVAGRDAQRNAETNQIVKPLGCHPLIPGKKYTLMHEHSRTRRGLIIETARQQEAQVGTRLQWRSLQFRKQLKELFNRLTNSVS